MGEKPYNLRPVWHAILDVYRAFDAVCKKHNLRYYAGYGTVIGAIRHHGFIPWDDDFDVIMPRPDYEKFLNLANQNLPPAYQLVSLYNTKSKYDLSFAKIQDARREVVERVSVESGLPLDQGIYMDIFPLDGWCKFTFNSYKLRSLNFRICGKDEFNYGSFKIFLASVIGRVAKFLFPQVKSERDLALLVNQYASRIKYETADQVAYVNRAKSSWYPTRPIRKEWLGKPIEVPFEDVMLPIPRNYDAYLRAYYGDYMTPPPPEKRTITHIGLKEPAWKYGLFE